jgi:hypothetical protein
MRLRIRAVLLAVAGCACVGAAVAVAVGACVVVPPPDMQQRPPHRPTILHASVDPPAVPFLTDWPPNGTFNVPVQFEDPATDVFVWVALVDQNDQAPANRQLNPQPAAALALDGGVGVVPITLDPANVDLSQCHVIEVRVAHNFAYDRTGGPLYSTFDSVGGDMVWWHYVGPAGPCGCSEVDAGGAPAADASSDGLPIPPVEGGGDL